jgi:hypothetical protein
LAELKLPPKTLENAGKYLDSLSSDDDTKYGETNAIEISDLSTAMGLMLRRIVFPDAYTADNPAIQRAIKKFDKTGPAKNDAAFNFYVTLFFYTNPGREWDDWHRKTRRLILDAQVIDAQEKDVAGAPLGNWWNKDDVAASHGGRLRQTALNTLTLEVYYRYLPLFHQEKVAEK